MSFSSSNLALFFDDLALKYDLFIRIFFSGTGRPQQKKVPGKIAGVELFPASEQLFITWELWLLVR